MSPSKKSGNLGMVGCGTAEMAFREQARRYLNGFKGVVKLEFKEKEIVISVNSEENGKALPKSYMRRAISYKIVEAPPKPLPCLIGDNSPAEQAARKKITELLSKRKGVGMIEYKGRTEVVARVETEADGKALPKTCQGRKVTYVVTPKSTVKAGPAKGPKKSLQDKASKKKSHG